MKKQLLFWIFFIIILIGSGSLVWFSSIQGTYKNLNKPTPSVLPRLLDAKKIFNLINQYRTSKGLTALVWDNSMCSFANKRLQEIHTDYSHKGFYNEAKNAYGYNFYLGENINKNFIDEQDAVDSWIKSPDHLKNIIYSYTRTCVTADRYNKDTYAVQEFASN